MGEQKRLYPFLYANPPKGWTGHIPENWREEITMANEAQRQKALALLFSEEVQDALEMTGHTIVNEAFAVGDPAEREAYNSAMRILVELATTEPAGYGAESSIRYCIYCRADDEGIEYYNIEHAPDCPWLKVRAFLAQTSG